jgi:hypothetical protein
MLISNSKFQIFSSLLFLAFISRASASITWSVTDSQFRSRPIAVESIDAAGIHPASSDQPVLSWDNVVELSQNPTASSVSPGRFTLILQGGDNLTGEPVAMKGDTLDWRSIRLSEINFPIGSAVAIVRTGSAVSDLDQTRTDDVVRLANGDVAHGVVTQVAPEGVTIQTADATPTLPWDSVTAVLFSTPPLDSAAADRRLFRVHFTGDESVTVPGVALAAGGLTLSLDDKTTRQVDPAAVTEIEQLNGPISWLTAHKPSENIYKPFFSENFPTRFDRTVEGGTPIREKYPAFHHGIGCHSYSKLSYDLDGKWAGFTSQFAIDSDSPLADVTVRIYLDNHPIFEQKNVKAGQIYPLKIIPLGSAKTISLEVDYGENYATEDRFVWLDPALIRNLPVPATQP